MKDFDLEAYAKRCVYDEDLQRTIIEGSLPSIPHRIAGIEEAYRNGKAPRLEREAHGLKGTCGNLSALRLQETAKTIEMSVKSGEVREEVEGLIREAREGLDRFIERVRDAGLYSGSGEHRSGEHLP